MDACQCHSVPPTPSPTVSTWPFSSLCLYSCPADRFICMRLLFCIIKPTHPYFFNHVILTFFSPPNKNQGKNLKAEWHQSTISKEGERYHPSSHHYSRCHSHFGFFSSSLLFEARVFQRLVEVLLFSKSCLSLCDPRDCSPPPHRPAPLSMGFLRQEYWNGLLFPSSGDLPDPGMEPESPALAGGFLTTEPPGKPLFYDV